MKDYKEHLRGSDLSVFDTVLVSMGRIWDGDSHLVGLRHGAYWEGEAPWRIRCGI